MIDRESHDWIKGVRRYFHQHPELSFHEYNTQKKIRELLNELGNKSLNDKTGNYVGSIWIINFENSDIIVTDMALGSGGIAYHFFDCNGEKHSNLENLSLDELNYYLSDSAKIFTNIN